jgi:hypothetical protein
MICGGKHPDIEAQAIQEKWNINRTALAALRADRPKAPAVQVRSAEVVTSRLLEAASMLTAKAAGVEELFDKPTLEAAQRIMLGGQEITYAEATRILRAENLTDDSGTLRLMVIGTEADRRRVLDNLKGSASDMAGLCLGQDYPPDYWALARAEFCTAGKPTIYVQAPDGRVLHRQDDYADGADGLRLAFENIRKPDPQYLAVEKK